MLLSTRTFMVHLTPAPATDADTEPVAEQVGVLLDTVEAALRTLLEEASDAGRLSLTLEVRT